jgi:UDP-N-acetylmuramate--alanine ligase
MKILDAKKLYMVGIKGVGMTMLAQYLKKQGIDISGSDVVETFMTDEVLAKEGIQVIAGFAPGNIPMDADMVIHSSAYNPDNNVEMLALSTSKKKVFSYAQAMGEVFNTKYGIAVAGSHGKTTTTAWLGYVMHHSGLRPNVMVGAVVPQFGGASLSSSSDYLVIEADEYQNKLNNFNPQLVLLNNIDFDHPDFFSDENHYEKVFADFVARIPSKGFLVANFDDQSVRRIAGLARCRVISYGLNADADYVAYDIKLSAGKQVFKVKLGVDESDDDNLIDPSESYLGDFAISLMGVHNISNALAVIAACVELGVDLAAIRRHLEDFTGTARRAQVLGTFKGATIIDDYAHHPTEIKTTLSGIKSAYPDKKITVVFHPHTFTRTKALLNDFASSFAEADELVVLDIYGSAREEHGGVHSLDLIKIIKETNERLGRLQEVVHASDLAKAEDYLRQTAGGRNQLIVLMGAGDIFRIGENLAG